MCATTGVSREQGAFLGWHRAALRLGNGSEAAHALLALSAHYEYAAHAVETAQGHATAALRKLAVVADEEASPAAEGERGIAIAWEFYTCLWEADLAAPVLVQTALLELSALCRAT